MFRVLTSIILISISHLSFATSVVPTEIYPDQAELESLSISIEFNKGASCGSASDIYINLPKEYNSAIFNGATLELKENNEIMLFSNLPKIDSAMPNYSGPPFYGTSFCLHPSKYNSAEVSIFYNNGPYTTDIITITNLELFAK